MEKIYISLSGGGGVMQQRCWAFLVIFLVSGFAFALTQAIPETGTVSGNGDMRHKEAVIELTEDNWRSMLKGEWMVEFFAPWCPACKNLAPTWERFAVTSVDLGVNVAKIDVTTSTSLSGRFFVTALPTIYHVKDGEFRQYRGSRDFDALIYFIKQKQWSKLEPISAWKKPDTVHMSILSYIFKLSHTLKEFNARLQEEYGLPTWAAYAFFAIGTIFVGAALGLMLVCVIDFLYPPKKTQRQSFSEAKEKQQNGIEDIANDEIEDEEINENEEDEEGTGAGEDEEQNEDIEEVSSSDGEKNSPSESEDADSEKNKTEAAKIEDEKSSEEKSATTSPSEVRKRKPRKAD
uniref:Thioredoxin-related transmembrane protein 1 n=1 Tax=Glossina austeni TaxID=7395 RepID=A0A1A9UGZ3_GLOAU